MTEKEKAHAGYLYDANNDPEIAEDHLRTYVRRFVDLRNSLFPFPR